jgi:copper chaperone
MADLIELQIEGMHCDGCVRRLTAILRKIPGVVLEEVKVGSARLRSSSPHEALRSEIIAALAGTGFSVSI